MQVELTWGYLLTAETLQTCTIPSQINLCERKRYSQSSFAFNCLSVGHRVDILRNFHLRMSDIGITLCILGTDPQPSEAILLLRTIAIYSGSKRVAIPLSTTYVVRSGTSAWDYAAHCIHRHL